MSTEGHRIVGWVLLIAWTATLGLLIPLPPTVIQESRVYFEEKMKIENEKKSPSTLSKKDIDRYISFNSSRIWLEWSLKLLLCLVGLTGALLALQRWKRWDLVVFCTSILYLSVWLVRQGTLPEPFIEAYLSYANALLDSGELGLILRFVLYSFLLPVFHLTIIANVLLERNG